MKFLDVKTDFAFKKVFGSDKSQDILISFLNALITFHNNEKIIALEIVDPYNIPLLKGMKDSYVDVRAKLDNDTSVIIEMQVLNVESFEKRILYNAAKQYSIQLVKGENYELLNPVIALTILDFEMFPDQDKVISNFKLLEKESLIEYSDDIELIFIELPKFNKALTELTDITDRWIYFIKHAGDLDYIPENMDGEIQQAFEIINEAGMSVAELEVQHKRQEFIWMQKSALRKAEKIGLKQGIEQEKKRSEEKQKELIIAMRQNDLTEKQIAKIINMSTDGRDKTRI